MEWDLTAALRQPSIERRSIDSGRFATTSAPIRVDSWLMGMGKISCRGFYNTPLSQSVNLIGQSFGM